MNHLEIQAHRARMNVAIQGAHFSNNIFQKTGDEAFRLMFWRRLADANAVARYMGWLLLAVVMFGCAGTMPQDTMLTQARVVELSDSDFIDTCRNGNPSIAGCYVRSDDTVYVRSGLGEERRTYTIIHEDEHRVSGHHHGDPEGDRAFKARVDARYHAMVGPFLPGELGSRSRMSAFHD